MQSLMVGILWFSAAPAVDVERLKVYMLQKLHHELQPGLYVIVYFHTAVQRSDNYPGLWALRDIYETLPNQLKHRMQAVYVVHPGLRSRVVLATLGRIFLSEGYDLKFIASVVYIDMLLDVLRWFVAMLPASLETLICKLVKAVWLQNLNLNLGFRNFYHS